MAFAQNDPQNQQPANGETSTGGTVADQNQAADPDQNANGNPETATQEDLSSSDGAGIRGGYGDASQENGLEGGPESAPDGSPGK